MLSPKFSAVALTLTFIFGSAIPALAQDENDIIYLAETFDNTPTPAGEVPQGWEILEGADSVAVTGEEGAKFLRLTDTADDNVIAIRSRYFTAKRGDKFTLQARIRTPHEENPAIFLNFVNGFGEDVGNIPVIAAPENAETWAEIETTIEAPKGAEAVALVLYSFPLPVGEFDLDDITLNGPRPKDGSPLWSGPAARPDTPRKLKNDEVPDALYSPTDPAPEPAAEPVTDPVTE